MAIFRDGSFTTDQITYIDGKCFDIEKNAETDITNCEVYFDEVQEELNLSDQIIFGDFVFLYLFNIAFKISGIYNQYTIFFKKML